MPRLGPWHPLPLCLPLWVQPVGASAHLGLQVREGKEPRPELPDPGPSPGLTQRSSGCSEWEGPRVESEQERAATPSRTVTVVQGRTQVHDAVSPREALTTLRRHGPYSRHTASLPIRQKPSDGSLATSCRARAQTMAQSTDTAGHTQPHPGLWPQARMVTHRDAHTNMTGLLLLGTESGPEGRGAHPPRAGEPPWPEEMALHEPGFSIRAFNDSGCFMRSNTHTHTRTHAHTHTVLCA